jgi:hypothetical protein
MRSNAIHNIVDFSLGENQFDIVYVTCFISERPPQASAHRQTCALPAHNNHVMPQPQQSQKTYTEADVQLAISDIKAQRVQSVKQAADIYNVPRRTINRRRAGKRMRRDCEANSKRLTKLEEEAIVQRVLEQSAQGLAPSRSIVREMADRLLRSRGSNPVGKNWVDNFVKRTPELRKRWSRPYDYQRAACEDPAAIQRWFDLIQETKQKYGIVDDDVHNFDETGFMMGKISAQMVITGSEAAGRKKVIQLGSCEWVTIIQGVSAAGYLLLPFVIFAGSVLINTWFEDLPRDWILEVSPNGWTNNQLALAWLEHFDTHTKRHTVGGYRLLIIDGHESHSSLEFQDLCKEKNIILRYMPPHSSHLLQPLDVGCFAPLKRRYGDQISALARNRIHFVSKETFLQALKPAFEQSLTAENIKAGFRGAGLVPHNPDTVLSKLDVRLQTPALSSPVQGALEAQTPRNAREIEAQSTLIRQRMQNRHGSSTSSLDEKIRQLSKGAQQIAHNMVLLQEGQARMQSAIDELTKRRSRKRKYIQTEETLTVGEVQDLIAEREGGEHNTGEGPAPKVRGVRHCRRCGEKGHNSRTCKVEIENAEDSDESEE